MSSQPASTSEEQNYAVFSPSSIQNSADSIGLDSLPDDILNCLSEDVSYRVRELVSKSCEFMRCSRRKQLKSCDVDRALKWSSAKPINGVSSSLKFSTTEGIYYSEESVVDLKAIAFEPIIPIQRHPISFSIKWLPSQNFFVAKNDVSSTDGNKSKENLGYEGYYTSIVECILSDNSSLFEIMLHDLRNSPRMGPVIKYLTTFVSGANVVSHDLTKLSRMLFVVKALLSNRFISVQLYLKPLLKAVLYCVLEPLAASINPSNDHWIVRDYGALLAAELIYSFAPETTALLNHTHSLITDILSDTTRPLCSHYGAIILTSQLGKDSIRKLLLPIVFSYVTTFLQPFMDDLSADNMTVKSDAQMVFGACKFCIEKLNFEHDVGIPGLRVCYPDIEGRVLELFGDSSAVSLPICNDKSEKKSKKKTESDMSIPWQHYSLTTNLHNSANLPKRRKMNIGDVFSPQLPLRRLKPIFIAFGLQKTCKRRVDNNDTSHTTPTSSQLQLVRRISPVRRKRNYVGLLTWL